MALLAYNKTTSPLALAAGSPIVTLPASLAAGARGPAYNVTGELNGLSVGNYALLQAQVVAGQVEYEWTAAPEYLTPGLTTFSAIVTSSDKDFSQKDSFVYVSAVNGNDSNDGLLRQMPLLSGGFVSSPAIQSGSSTSVDTSGGSTVLNMAVNAYVGYELRLLHTIAPAVATSQSRLIVSNTSTALTVFPAFDVSPVLGDTFIVVSPVKTIEHAMAIRPASWGLRNQVVFAKEGGIVNSGSSASIVTGAAEGMMRITGLSGMSVNSVGRTLSLGAVLSTGAPVGTGASATTNRGAFEIAGFISSSSVDVKNFNYAGGNDAANGSISWMEIDGYVTDRLVVNSGTRIENGNNCGLTIIGDFTDELGTLNAIAGTSNVQVVTAGLGLPTGTVSAISSLTSQALPPSGGQQITGFVGLTPNAHVGKNLLMASGNANGTDREIIANDATSVTVAPAFPASIQNVQVGDSMSIDLAGAKILFLTGAAAGQRKYVREIVGGATIIPDEPFNPAPANGDTFRIEHAAVKIRVGGSEARFQGGADIIASKGLHWIITNASTVKVFYFQGVMSLDEGSEFSLGGKTCQAADMIMFVPANNQTSQILPSLATFSVLRRASRFMRDGTQQLAAKSHAIYNSMYSNMLIDIFNDSIFNWGTVNGRQMKVILRTQSQATPGNNAAIRGKFDRSLSTVATDGMVNVLDGSLFGHATGAAVNMDFNNGLGHGFSVYDNGFANLGNIGGTGNAGFGIVVHKQGHAQIRTSGGNQTTITGTSGDTKIGSEAAGIVAPAIGVVRSYAQLNQTKGFCSNVSIVPVGTRTESSGGSTTVVTDSTLSAVVNDYSDALIYVITGAAAGQTRRIISNTATSFTTDIAFSVAIGIGDTWTILPANRGSFVEVTSSSP